MLGIARSLSRTECRQYKHVGRRRPREGSKARTRTYMVISGEGGARQRSRESTGRKKVRQNAAGCHCLPPKARHNVTSSRAAVHGHAFCENGASRQARVVIRHALNDKRCCSRNGTRRNSEGADGRLLLRRIMPVCRCIQPSCARAA